MTTIAPKINTKDGIRIYQIGILWKTRPRVVMDEMIKWGIVFHEQDVKTPSSKVTATQYIRYCERKKAQKEDRKVYVEPFRSIADMAGT